MKTVLKRRLEARTDYKKRLNLLKGNMPRIVFRKTNRYIIGQYVTSREAQDRIETGVISKDLLGYGWPQNSAGSLKSLPASYLTGMLLSKKIIEKKLDKKVILDIGMIRNIHKTKIYAFAKGVVDGGIKLNIDEKTLPEKDRMYGKHMKNKIDIEKIKLEIEKSR